MQLYADKSTDRMLSTFTAVGLAELLDNIPPVGAGQEVTMQDMGSCYLIDINMTVEQLTEYVRERGALPPILPAIKKKLTKGDRDKIESGIPEEEILLKYVPRGFPGQQIDYQPEKDRFDRWRKQKRTSKQRDVDEVNPPAGAFPVWAHLCSYFGKGSAMRGGYQTPLHMWHAHRDDRALALWQIILDCYGQFPNDTAAAYAAWNETLLPELKYTDYKIKSDVSTLAVVSPSTSKGISNVSGNQSLSEDTPNIFWLEMYFGFVGFLEIGMPFNLSGDVVTYYPVPHNIQLPILRQIIAEYRRSADARSLYRYSNSMNHAKVDVLQQIRFYQKMVEMRLNTLEKGDTPWPLNTIDGLIGYYYKDIATQIPFDETMFALPAWIDPEASAEQLAKAVPVLKQHNTLIDSIRGRPPKYSITGDEVTLLETYRRYATHGNADDWIQFAIHHGLYRFRHMPDMPKFPALSIQLFKESFPMTQHISDKADYRPILENEGFQNVAKAVNYCTSYARYKRDVQKDRTFAFKVRHGLGDDLLQNAHDPALFIEDLSKFVHEYRRESINVQADTGQGRSEIQPQDVQQVVELIAEYGSRVVAHLLVATGYAADFRSRGD